MRYSLLLASVALAAPAPLIEAEADRRVPHTYIVKLKDIVSRAARDDTLSTLSATADHVYDGTVFNGFSATLQEDELDRLRHHPDVEYIEEDAIYTVKAEVADDLETRQAADDLEARQVSVPWNLIRISHRANVGTGNPYVYDSTAGTGTCIYILDSGINVAHTNFGGRATNVANFAGGANTDANGHGTAIAGIAAATEVGVSRRSRVFGVKVFSDSGSGTTSGIISGLSFVATDAPSRGCLGGGFVNFAGAGAFSTALNNAAASLVSRGHFLAADAGASNAPVSGVSPASAPGVCAVGPTDRNDRIPASTNYGAVDIYAPGISILSLARTGGTVLYNALSATAHVTGVAAYVSSIAGLPANQVCNFLWETGTQNVLQPVVGARLLYNGGYD